MQNFDIHGLQPHPFPGHPGWSLDQFIRCEPVMASKYAHDEHWIKRKPAMCAYINRRIGDIGCGDMIPHDTLARAVTQKHVLHTLIRTVSKRAHDRIPRDRETLIARCRGDAEECERVNGRHALATRRVLETVERAILLPEDARPSFDTGQKRVQFAPKGAKSPDALVWDWVLWQGVEGKVSREAYLEQCERVFAMGINIQIEVKTRLDTTHVPDCVEQMERYRRAFPELDWRFLVIHQWGNDHPSLEEFRAGMRERGVRVRLFSELTNAMHRLGLPVPVSLATIPPPTGQLPML